ncbi:hypothetical protein [Streptomyces niveus]|uniref:hypothetical protein n=1 Tax=Streptomyces niveus TaxID=193462 RepID=UPI0036685FD0
MDRGFTRVFGTTKNSVLIAFALAGLNHILLRAWHTKRQLPDPWATFAGEETIKPTVPGPRTRARRRPNHARHPHRRRPTRLSDPKPEPPTPALRVAPACPRTLITGHQQAEAHRPPHNH